MFSGSIFYAGDEDACKEVEAHAIALANLVSAMKTSAGLDSMTREFDLPEGGFVRVYDSYHVSSLTIFREAVRVEGEEREEIEERLFSSRRFIGVYKASANGAENALPTVWSKAGDAPFSGEEITASYGGIDWTPLDDQYCITWSNPFYEDDGGRYAVYHRNNATPTLYNEGRVFAGLPQGVAGAAVYTHPTQGQWFVAATMSEVSSFIHKYVKIFAFKPADVEDYIGPNALLTISSGQWVEVAKFDNPDLESGTVLSFFNFSPDGSKCAGIMIPNSGYETHAVEITLDVDMMGDVTAIVDWQAKVWPGLQFDYTAESFSDVLPETPFEVTFTDTGLESGTIDTNSWDTRPSGQPNPEPPDYYSGTGHTNGVPKGETYEPFEEIMDNLLAELLLGNSGWTGPFYGEWVETETTVQPTDGVSTLLGFPDNPARDTLTATPVGTMTKEAWLNHTIYGTDHRYRTFCSVDIRYRMDTTMGGGGTYGKRTVYSGSHGVAVDYDQITGDMIFAELEGASTDGEQYIISGVENTSVLMEGDLYDVNLNVSGKIAVDDEATHTASWNGTRAETWGKLLLNSPGLLSTPINARVDSGDNSIAEDTTYEGAYDGPFRPPTNYYTQTSPVLSTGLATLDAPYDERYLWPMYMDLRHKHYVFQRFVTEIRARTPPVPNVEKATAAHITRKDSETHVYSNGVGTLNHKFWDDTASPPPISDGEVSVSNDGGTWSKTPTTTFDQYDFPWFNWQGGAALQSGSFLFSTAKQSDFYTASLIYDAGSDTIYHPIEQAEYLPQGVYGSRVIKMSVL